MELLMVMGSVVAGVDGACGLVATVLLARTVPGVVAVAARIGDGAKIIC